MALEAYETLQEIREQLKNMEFASLPAIVKTAQNLSKKVETMTNYELAAIIGKDPFATAKVLDLANKGSKDKVAVTKLEDAILSAGYGKVRGIAMKLLDSERIIQHMRQPEQEEVASINLVSCLIAEELMNIKSNYDASEVYTCTVLRGYGKVLMSTFLIETFREAMIILPSKGEEGAFRAAFGMTPIELSYELLSDSKLPKKIVRTIKPLDPQLLEQELLSTSEVDELLIFSEFVYRFTRLIFDLRLKADAFENKMLEQIEEFKTRLEFNTGHLVDCMSAVDGSLQQLEKDYEISPVPECVRETLNARINEEDPPRTFTGSQKVPTQEERAKRTPEDVIQSGVNQIMSICSKKEINPSKIHSAVASTLMDALKLQDCMVFVKDEDSKTVEYYPAVGEGDMFKHVKKRTKLKPGYKDVFGVALENQCDGLVFDTSKPNVNNLIPSWCTVDNVNSIFIYNFAGMQEPFLVVALRRDGETLQIPGGAMKALAKMRAAAMKSCVQEPDEKDYAVNFKTFLGALKKAAS